MDSIRSLWKKGIYLFIFSVVVLFLPLSVEAAEADLEVTIYGLNSTYLEKINIPDNFPQSYQLTIGGGKDVTYSIASGSSAKVSADGLITPKYTYWKRYSGYSASVPEGEEYDYYTMSAGDTTITAKTSDGTYTITVHVNNYAIVYGDGVMDAYLSENITEGMTDYEIMETIAKFPASYDYSASCSGVYSMIIYGGGDCWASTDAIVTLCEKLGIKAWSRNGNRDAGAGSGHMNAMAELNGKYYELEAGYAMSKTNGYRPYDVSLRTSLFSYYLSSGNAKIYQYDGYDTSGVLEIPETIDGYKVTGINKSAFSNTKFSEITLPDTLETIGDFAFSTCSNLQSIRIPASVTSIGCSVFTNCQSLTDISVASDNPSYKEVDQVIYSKDGTTLVCCPVAGNVTIPDSVTKIADYAFYYNANLQSITIPESVVTLGEGAISSCSKLSTVTIKGNGLTTIGTHCFRSNSSLSVIRIPASVNTIGAFAFAYCYKLNHIYFMGDAPAFGETIEGTFYDRVFYSCTATGYYPEGNTTWTEDVLTNHDGTINWLSWGGTETTSIDEAVLALEQDSYTYTGAGITPKVSLTLGDKALIENEDYIVSYTDNINAGKARVTVIGIGSYEGQLSESFTIEKAQQRVAAYVRNNTIKEDSTTEIYYVSSFGDYTYASDNTSVATIDSDGVITGISAGTAVITVNAAETDNYLAASTTVTITVTHDSEVVDSTVTDGRVMVQCKKCGEKYSATVPTAFSILWRPENSSYYYFYCNSEYEVGDVLECICRDTSDAEFDEMEIVSLDNSVITITENRYLNFIAPGVAKVEVRPKYNPSIGRVFTFTVKQGTAGAEDKNSNNTDQTGGDKTTAGTDDKNYSNADKEYYDIKTGITISVAGDNAKNVTLVSIDEKNAKGSLVIPNNIKVDGTTYAITGIAKNAFKNNKRITKITIGKNVKTIGANAFYGCKNVKTVTLGKNVTFIGDKAFYNCSKITKITIPSKVSGIGKQAFYNCKKLKNITIKTAKLTSKNVGSKAFGKIYSKAFIKVPKKKLEAYTALLKKKGIGKNVKIVK